MALAAVLAKKASFFIGGVSVGSFVLSSVSCSLVPGKQCAAHCCYCDDERISGNDSNRRRSTSNAWDARTRTGHWAFDGWPMPLHALPHRAIGAVLSWRDRCRATVGNH